MTDKTIADRARALVEGHVPGVAFAVVTPEGVTAAAGIGLADIAGGVAASPTMICPWFSMTKIATATTAMHLAEQGTLDMDEPVIGLVPALRRMRPLSRAERITPRHLLSHSAGFANPVPVRWIHPADRPGPDPQAFLERLLAKHDKLRFEPGTRSSYSNLGTLVLGSVIAGAGGQPFVDVVRDAILDPLGMRQTGFAYTADMDARAATGYHPRRSPMRFLLPRWVIGEPAGKWVSLRRFLLDGSAYGGLVGSVDDAARFLRMHLRDGELDGVKILGPDSAAEMREIRMQGRRFDLGLGWFRPANRRRADPPFIEHLGAGAGFFNVIRIYPSRRIGIAIMGNATKYDIDAVAALALEG